MKGRISRELEAILRDDEGRKRLRWSLVTGKEMLITVGDANYIVSTKSPISNKINRSGKLLSQRLTGFAKRTG